MHSSWRQSFDNNIRGSSYHSLLQKRRIFQPIHSVSAGPEQYEMLSSCGTVVVVVVVALVVLETASGETIIQPCPRIKCEPPCELTTGLGRCPTCVCSICPLIECDPPCKLITGEGRCPTCVCSICPLIECDPPFCKLITGEDICPICICFSCLSIECDPPCKLINGEGRCPMCVCPAIPTPPCPLIRCAPGWESTTGKDGCQTCVRLPSCEAVKCSEGYECQLVEVTCVQAPCFPQPQCVQIKKPCPPQDPCGIRCMYGLKTDKNGCQLCECLDKPPS